MNNVILKFKKESELELVQNYLLEKNILKEKNNSFFNNDTEIKSAEKELQFSEEILNSNKGNFVYIYNNFNIDKKNSKNINKIYRLSKKRNIMY